MNNIAEMLLKMGDCSSPSFWEGRPLLSSFPSLPSVHFSGSLVYSAAMRLIVTAGATSEPLDRVRRLTNFSTGRLGSELANFLTRRGHEVFLLLAESATYAGEQRSASQVRFTSSADLRSRIEACSRETIEGIFHAAAVSDFQFGKVYHRSESGGLIECREGKFSTRAGALWAELVPTPKLIRDLRPWFPQACLVGWKYETDGSRTDAVQKAREQILENQTDAAVANGPAYGFGFGLVRAAGEPRHFSRTDDLFAALEALLDPSGPPRSSRGKNPKSKTRNPKQIPNSKPGKHR